MCCLDQTCSVATHMFLALLSITDTTLYCDVIFLTITASILSGTYTVFRTRRFLFKILIVRRDHTQFSHPLLIKFQSQSSHHPKLPHISILLTLLSLPTRKAVQADQSSQETLIGF